MKMIKRQFWHSRIEDTWNRKSIIWLSGVRRVGKTCLCKSLPDIDYYDCELPRVRREMQDPEAFFESRASNRIVIDEIHRLSNPSELLKITADHFPEKKVIATGSSSLGASSKFSDTLAGRKIDIRLLPLLTADLEDFKNDDIKHRFFRGGLPPFFLAADYPEQDFQDWLHDFWAKDILELFRLERRFSFLKFAELLFSQSGGIFEATSFARPCEVSRPTISNYLSILDATNIVHVIRPFSTKKTTEIISAPKVYAFDTGFICYFKGWDSLRPKDIGFLWEHFVLNEILGVLQSIKINYWRDKRHHEVDFIIKNRGKNISAIECKWTAEHFDISGIKAFRKSYKAGMNFVVARDVKKMYRRTIQGITLNFVNLKDLIEALKKL